MMTRERELLQQALDALDRAISVAAQPAPADVGNLEYRGNSVSFIHRKMTAYRKGIDDAWSALKAAGVQPDGKTSVADAIAVLAAQPAPGEPVALESVHLTRDIKGMCTVRVNGRVAIQDNGDIIDHMATLEWFAQPAPVPLTDTETHAELWKLAVRKGLVTVRSELIDPRNHGTRVSWMQGHDKACDISNDAAAHGIAASPEQPK